MDDLRHPPPRRLALGRGAGEAAAAVDSRGRADAGRRPLDPQLRARGERRRVGTVCIYQATSPEAIRAHASAADLPVDEIIRVADTVIVRPDPGRPRREEGET